MTTKNSKSGKDGQSVFLYTVLRILTRLTLPLSMVGVVHCIYVLAAYPWVQAKLWIYPWLIVLGVFVVLGWLSALGIRSLLASGRLRKQFNQQAENLFERFKWRFMIDQEETPADAAILDYKHQKALLVLTNRRLIVATFNSFQTAINYVTDCERLAITGVVSRPLTARKLGWLTGVWSGAGLQITIAGIKEPQLLNFTEPYSMTRVLSLLESQPKLAAEKNGIRKIIFSAKRRALKRSYVESLFSPPVSRFNIILLSSAIFPGLGQIRQQRYIVGLTFVASAAAWLVGSLHSLQLYPRSDDEYFMLFSVELLIWLFCQIELFVNRANNVSAHN
ncbi:MAG: hypothetical protein ACI8P9_001019 [Parasphingorhabdus sp.]|jgi:hypothetical protein